MSNTITQKTITWGNGRTSLYAGTPLDVNGNPANDASAIGILAEDIHMPDRSANVLTAGVWDEDAHTACGIVLSDAAKAAMSEITFTHPPKEIVDQGKLAEALEAYVQKTDLATPETAGLVKQTAAVEDAADAPTQADFNGLLGALRTAGVINTQVAEDPDTPAGT